MVAHAPLDIAGELRLEADCRGAEAAAALPPAAAALVGDDHGALGRARAPP